jgi:hypothetical protein
MRTCSQKNTGGHSGPTEVSPHACAVCLRHLRLGSFLTGSGCPRHVRFTPDSDRPADIAGGPDRANFGSHQPCRISGHGISSREVSAQKQSGHDAKAMAYQVRVRAIAPATICIITPTTHPSIIIIVQKVCGFHEAQSHRPIQKPSTWREMCRQH